MEKIKLTPVQETIVKRLNKEEKYTLWYILTTLYPNQFFYIETYKKSELKTKLIGVALTTPEKFTRFAQYRIALQNL